MAESVLSFADRDRVPPNEAFSFYLRVDGQEEVDLYWESSPLTVSRGFLISQAGAYVVREAHLQQRMSETRGAKAMMTVVTTVTLKDAARSQWDRAMHERVRAASDMDGWVAVQLLREVDNPQRRAIIGTWQSREHWARWHDDEAFKATRAELAGLEDGPSNTIWYDVVEEQG